MGVALSGVGIVGAAVLVSLLVMVLVRRSVSIATLEEHNDVAGFVYAVLGVIYAVMLAFVVIAVWEQWEKADSAVESEAGAIATLVHIAEAFPDVDRGAVHQSLMRYIQVVITDEWEAMASGTSSQRAQESAAEIWRAYQRMEPTTPREAALYAESLRRLGDLEDARLARLSESQNALPAIMWAVLAIGGAVTVGYGLLFGVKSARSQSVITGALSGSIALSIFLIQTLDYPFRGDVRVQPHALHDVLADLQGASLSAPGTPGASGVHR